MIVYILKIVMSLPNEAMLYQLVGGYVLLPSFFGGDNIPGECLLLKIACHDNTSKEEITREDHSTAAPPPATL